MDFALVVLSSALGRPWTLHFLFVQMLKVVHGFCTSCLFKCLRSSMDFALVVCSRRLPMDFALVVCSSA
jgi:hypothetical protein